MQDRVLDHSGTIFAFHKMPLRMYVAAIAIFCNEVKGKSMLATAVSRMADKSRRSRRSL
jgi:hypothetical protein